MRVKRDGGLPDRCVVCNAAAAGERVARTLHWSPLAWRIGAFATPFAALWAGALLDIFFLVMIFWPLVAILLVAHFFVRSSLKLELGVCARHRRLRRALVATSVLCLVAVMLGIVAMVNSGSGFELLLGGAAALLVLAVAQRFVGVQTVSLKRLKDDDAWLAGTGKAFREALPELPG